jgi:hypothetical protein
MNRLSFIKLAGIALALFLAGCGDKDDDVNKIALKSITVEPVTSVALVVGETQQLTATAVPADASDVNFEWTSANTTIATVSVSGGLVTAVGAGSTIVTVKSGNVKTDVPVTVSEFVPDLESFTVTPASLNMMLSVEPVQLTVNKTPANAGGSFTWTSDNESVVEVSEAGLVTAIGSGITTITVTSGDLTVTVPVGVARQSITLGYDNTQTHATYDVEITPSFFVVTTTAVGDPQIHTTALSEDLDLSDGTSVKIVFECITNRATNTYTGEHNPDIPEYTAADWMQIYFFLRGWAGLLGPLDFLFIPQCDDWTEISFDIPSNILAGGFGIAGDWLRIDPVGRGGNWNNPSTVGYSIAFRNLRIVTY